MTIKMWTRDREALAPKGTSVDQALKAVVAEVNDAKKNRPNEWSEAFYSNVLVSDETRMAVYHVVGYPPIVGFPEAVARLLAMRTAAQKSISSREP
jgi:hypothetical protein